MGKGTLSIRNLQLPRHRLSISASFGSQSACVIIVHFRNRVRIVRLNSFSLCKSGARVNLVRFLTAESLSLLTVSPKFFWLTDRFLFLLNIALAHHFFIARG
jgi:hypothetical protein